MKKSILISLLLALGLATVTQAQYQSNFIENELIFGESLKLSDTDYKAKKITILLPSVSANFLSPELAYGDFYVAETKSLDLVKASRSEKDFDLHMNARVSYGGLALRLGKYNFSLMHEFTIDGTAKMPNHVIVAITKGNTALTNETVEINPSVQMQSVHKWSIGMDYENSNLMAGIQLHYLRGDAFFDTGASSLNVSMEDNFFEISFDKTVDIRSSGVVDYQDVDSIDVIIEQNAFSTLGKSANHGLGLSAHFKYLPTKALSLFGRVEDLGYIKWKNENNILMDESHYEFKGFDVQQAYSTGEAINIQDTINNFIAVDKQTGAFKGALNYSVMLGAQYQLHKRFSMGLIARSKQYGHRNLLFVETQAIVKPLPNTFLAVSNIYYQSAPINLKLVLQTEIKRMFGFNVSVINPWQYGTYYEANMLHASLGMYVKI